MDRLLVNAKIYTLDGSVPSATTLAIWDGRIIEVGGSSLKALATPQTQIDDLHGATVIPGLTDAHIHWAWTSRSLQEVDLFDVPTKEDALRLVGEATNRTATDVWLVGHGWAQSLWPVA